jgi:hypothetical protein
LIGKSMLGINQSPTKKCLVTCVTAQEVYKAVREGQVPIIAGSFAFALHTNCRVLISEGSPRIAVLSGAPRIELVGNVNLQVVTWTDSSPNIYVGGVSYLRLESLRCSKPKVRASGRSSVHLVTLGESVPSVVIAGECLLVKECHGMYQPEVNVTSFGRLRGF